MKYEGLEIDGREYLEKILNYSFYVPEPEIAQVAEFAISRLEDLVLDDEKREQYQDYFREFGRVLQECHFNNPRKIKRILNRYLLFISKYENELAKYDNLNTVRLIILAEYFPSLFQLFLKDASAVKVELIKIGDSEFDVKQFEGKFGVSIAAIYPQLSRMNKLFNLELPIDDIKPNLTEHAQAVFSITRLT